MHLEFDEVEVLITGEHDQVLIGRPFIWQSLHNIVVVPDSFAGYVILFVSMRLIFFFCWHLLDVESWCALVRSRGNTFCLFIHFVCLFFVLHSLTHN